MFGRSRPVVFDPYPSRRSRGRPPAWLVTAVLGIALGAGGVLYVQERYLPQRLSPEQSAEAYMAACIPGAPSGPVIQLRGTSKGRL